MFYLTGLCRDAVLQQRRAALWLCSSSEHSSVLSVVVSWCCSSSVTGFCRDAIYSLTTDYNNGALRCDCSPDGSVSFNCAEFGGQCRCRPNIIGRTCSHCRTGYYGFPDCRRTYSGCSSSRSSRSSSQRWL